MGRHRKKGIAPAELGADPKSTDQEPLTHVIDMARTGCDDHPRVCNAEVRRTLRPRARVCVVVATAAIESACEMATGHPSATTCPAQSVFVEPARVERIGVESSEAVRLADDEVRALLEESLDWRLAPTVGAADVVLRVEVDFWLEERVRGVGGPGPPPDFWRTLLSPLLTVEPERCAQPNDWIDVAQHANHVPVPNALD